MTAEWQAVKKPAKGTFYSNSRVGQCRFSLQSLVAAMGVQQAPRKVSPSHIYGPGPGPPGAIYDRPHTLRDYGQVSALLSYQQKQYLLASQPASESPVSGESIKLAAVFGKLVVD